MPIRKARIKEDKSCVFKGIKQREFFTFVGTINLDHHYGEKEGNISKVN